MGENHRKIPVNGDLLPDALRRTLHLIYWTRRSHHVQPAIQFLVSRERSRRDAGALLIGREVAQAISYPGPVLPCEPRIFRVSMETVPGGQPKNNSQGS